MSDADVAARVDRIREVYPADRPTCPWCAGRKGRHHFDCPVPDVQFLLAQLTVSATPPSGREP
jgi:hypothetical protein